MERQMRQVAVNVTTEGMVEIRQEGMDDDDVILLHPAQIPLLVEFLTKAADDALNDEAEAG